ncbi:hypothetical protein EYF80_011369 [Liparis tanakae]|uniref:Uncharacterized protein n=1 Tax=Liparis tanakae TaxID=230148 RepID=A0A4Z2IKP5_9TELE|nr:hypothetical protein EYF80_011369 [Liparis tanakae]
MDHYPLTSEVASVVACDNHNPVPLNGNASTTTYATNTTSSMRGLMKRQVACQKMFGLRPIPEHGGQAEAEEHDEEEHCPHLSAWHFDDRFSKHNEGQSRSRDTLQTSRQVQQSRPQSASAPPTPAMPLDTAAPIPSTAH